MFDVVILVLVLSVCFVALHLLGVRIVTALAATMVLGWGAAGLLLYYKEDIADFDSESAQNLEKLYVIMSVLAFLFLLVTLIVTSYKDIVRNRIIKRSKFM